jgi:twitching motility protein PilT
MKSNMTAEPHDPSKAVYPVSGTLLSISDLLRRFADPSYQERGICRLSTLHTKDTKGAISRIVDMFPPDRFKELCTQLSFSLSYVIAQRLLPAAGGTGLRVVMEVLKNIPSVANLIRTGNWQQLCSAMEIQGRQGMNTFDHHLSALVDSGEIARKIAMRHASDPGRFADD